MAGLGLVVLTVLTFAPPRDATQLALVFPPWLSREEVFARIADLDVRLVRNGLLESVLIVDFAHDPALGEAIRKRAPVVADARVIFACLGANS